MGSGIQVGNLTLFMVVGSPAESPEKSQTTSRFRPVFGKGQQLLAQN